MIRIYKTGAHAHRTPFSYPALAPLLSRDFTLVDQPGDADLYVFAHCLDIQEAPRALIEDWRQRQVPVVWLSEEPFWDTIWGKRPLDPTLIIDTPHGAVPVHQLNHQTSAIFRFDQIPYYLLTNPRFATAYQAMFVRNAARDAADWQAEFTARAAHVSLMFERRPEPWHWVDWPQASLIGLCAWRTEMAEACTGPGVERLGHRWDGRPPRQSLADWHQDKLARLDGHARYIGAYENTHHPDYITEKLFDAFACGAVPLYYAAPDHRIHDWDLPPEAWINGHGLTPGEAATALAGHRITASVCTAYAEAQRVLAERFTCQGVFAREQERLRGALLTAFEQVLASHAPS